MKDVYKCTFINSIEEFKYEKVKFVNVPEYPYENNRKQFSFSTFLMKSEVLKTLPRIRIECDKLAGNSIFQVNITKTMKVDEFEQAQMQSITIAKTFLRDSWLPTIKNIIKTGLKDTGKGWFNMQESNMEVYKICKLKKFMTALKFMMQDSVRSLVLNSMNDYVKMIHLISSQTVVVSGTNDIRIIDNISKGIHFVLENAVRKPLFSLELVFRHGKVMFNVDLKVFEEALVHILEKGLSAAEGLPELEPVIMDKIFWASRPMLDFVHPKEHVVINMIEKLRKAFRESLPPLEKYLRHYDKHLKLLNLDIAQFAATYEEENKSIEEMEQDIVNHTHAWESLERDIPSHVNIGLFYLGCENIRSAMRKDLSKVVLDIIAKKTAKLAASITQAFTAVSNRLKDKPTKIEEQMELREYLKTVPDTIKLQQVRIVEMMKNYEVLDRYRYDTSNEDVRAKWSVFALPQKIDDQLKSIESNLEGDELVFKNRLLADQEIFTDRINTLNTFINDFSKYIDIDMINEINEDSTKISLELKECQQLVALFNSREKLFGIEPTAYDQVGQFLRDFEPYKNLWATTGEWLKSKDAWRLGAFVDLNAEEVEKNIANAYKVVYKSIKQFKNQPGCLAVATKVRMNLYLII